VAAQAWEASAGSSQPGSLHPAGPTSLPPHHPPDVAGNVGRTPLNPEGSSEFRRAAILKITDLLHTCKDEGLIIQINRMLQASMKKDSYPDDVFKRQASLSKPMLHKAPERSLTCPDLPATFPAGTHGQFKEAMQNHTAPELQAYAGSPLSSHQVSSCGSLTAYSSQCGASTTGTLPPYLEKLEVTERQYPCGKAWTDNQLPDFHQQEQQPYGQSMAQWRAMGKRGWCQTRFQSRAQVHDTGVSTEEALPGLSDIDLMAVLQGLGQAPQWTNMPPRMGPDEGQRRYPKAAADAHMVQSTPMESIGPEPSQLHGGSPSTRSAGRCAGKGGPQWAPSQPPRQPPWTGDLARNMARNVPPTKEPFQVQEAAPDTHKWQPRQVLTDGALPSWREANLREQKGYPDVGRTGQLVNQAIQHHLAAADTAPDLPFPDEQPVRMFQRRVRMFQRSVLQHPMWEPPPPPAHSADLRTALARTTSSHSIEQTSPPTRPADEVEMIARQPNWDPTALACAGKGSQAVPCWGPNAPKTPVWDAKGCGKGSLMEASRKEQMQHLHSKQEISQQKDYRKALTEGALPLMEDNLWEQDPPRQHRVSGNAVNSSQIPWNHERQSHFGGVPELPNLNFDGDLPLRQQFEALAKQRGPGWHHAAHDSNESLWKVPTCGDLPSFRRASGGKVPTEGDLPTMHQLFSKAEKRVTFEPRFGKGESSIQQLRPPPGLEMPPEFAASTGRASASPCATAAVAAAASVAADNPHQITKERF